jgi:tetratricopeptide (TPR) repeat protein
VEEGYLGTAFLISRKHRLLVTAAHLADEASAGHVLLARSQESSVAYRVDRIWYHPGLIRRFALGLYGISMDPRDGEVSLPTFDIAILHLAESKVELPKEICELADDGELSRLREQVQVAVLGFPMDAGSNSGPRDHRQAAIASLGTGVVTRMVAYTAERAVDEHAPAPQRRWIRTNTNLGKGTSGGPLFLANGHVIGVYSGSSITAVGIPFEEFPRIDAVREMLAYYGLEDTAEINHFVMRDDRTANHANQRRRLLIARDLVEEADRLRSCAQYHRAVDLCHKAIELVPGYAWAYFRRGQLYVEYCCSQWRSLTPGEILRFTELGSDDMLRCSDLLQEWNLYPSVYSAYAELYHGLATSQTSEILENIEYLDGLLEKAIDRGDDAGAAMVVNCRAHCRVALGDSRGANKDFEEAIRLEPDEHRWRIDLENFLRKHRLDPSRRDAGPKSTPQRGEGA